MKKMFLTYDNTNVSDEVHKKLLDLNNYYNFAVDGWDTLTTTNLDQALIELANTGYDYAVVSALGNYLRLHSIDDEIIQDCINNNSPFASHLIDKSGYYNIDPQFFCLNLKVWASLNYPKFETNNQCETFESTTVVRSEDNVHDNYTPLWLEPGNTTTEYSNVITSFGSHVIRSFLEAGYKLININQNIRNRKIYLYPNYSEAKIKNLFDTWQKPVNNIPLEQFYDSIQQHFDVYESTVYVLNSERVLNRGYKQIDHYIGVCGGLKAVAILYNNTFTEHTRVSLFDISTPAIDYQRYLVSNWDGDLSTYYEVFNTYKNKYPDLTYAWRSWNSWESEIEKFLQSGRLTREQFKETWQRYIKLNIDYNCVNLLDQTQVKNYFNSLNSDIPKEYYVWISNSYRMEHTIVRYGSEYLKKCSNELVNVVSSLNGTVRLENENGLNRLK